MKMREKERTRKETYVLKYVQYEWHLESDDFIFVNPGYPLLWLGISAGSSALSSGNNSTDSWPTSMVMFSPANCHCHIGNGY